MQRRTSRSRNKTMGAVDSGTRVSLEGKNRAAPDPHLPQALGDTDRHPLRPSTPTLTAGARLSREVRSRGFSLAGANQAGRRIGGARRVSPEALRISCSARQMDCGLHDARAPAAARRATSASVRSWARNNSDQWRQVAEPRRLLRPADCANTTGVHSAGHQSPTRRFVINTKISAFAACIVNRMWRR
jgi:hypothetical protein